MRILIYLGLYGGPPTLGNYHISSVPGHPGAGWERRKQARLEFRVGVYGLRFGIEGLQGLGV